MKVFIIALAFCGLASAQFLPLVASSRYSATTGDVSLSGSATTLTIQQPATGAKQVALETATVYCSVACNVTQAQNGAAATATAATLTPITSTGQAPSATAWTASNVGSGTAVGPILHLAAGATVVIDLSRVTMGTGGTGTNYSVTVSSITGTANITILENEK